MEIGVTTFAEVRPDPAGRRISPAERLNEVVEEAVLADQVGLDVFGVGEHHRPDFASSAPVVALAAIAAKTSQIRLTSAVTVLSSDDPVRVFEAFSMLDLLSNGRAEIMVGRGSFIESFPLFGYDLAEYDSLFAAKLELLLKLRAQARVTWNGRYRPALENSGVYPRPLQQPLPVWIAVGGTPSSGIRAGSLGLPIALAIIGGMPERFGPFVELYRDAARGAGIDPATLPLAINSHAYIADSSQQAAAEFYPSYVEAMNAVGRERGWAPIGRGEYDALRSRRGALLVGSPQEVIDKILSQHELFDHQRFLAQFSVGTLPHRQILRCIELLGTVVAPALRTATT
jgi:probable LLM family oxidoreductase